jgi:hypothetical protein
MAWVEWLQVVDHVEQFALSHFHGNYLNLSTRLGVNVSQLLDALLALFPDIGQVIRK